jgi:hypothetical protein
MEEFESEDLGLRIGIGRLEKASEGFVPRNEKERMRRLEIFD